MSRVALAEPGTSAVVPAEGAALTWAQLRDLKCAGLEDAADGWARASHRADAARARLDKQVLAGLADAQRGEAAGAAVARLRRLSRDVAYIHTECGLIRTTLNSLAEELRGPQRTVRRALDEAESLGFTVRPDGSVSYPAAGDAWLDGKVPGPSEGGTAEAKLLPSPRGPAHLTSRNPNAAKARSIADLIARATAEARALDARYTATLSRLSAQDVLRAEGDAVWRDAYGDAVAVRGLAAAYLRDAIPTHASPRQRKAWWDGLTPRQREEYVDVYPDVIGNLDGIPADVRDRANRENLRLLIAKLAGRDDEGSRTRVEGLREINRRLAEGGSPPMYLLGIGDEGNGRAIVSYGNPDTARNVSAYVPGLGTALDRDFAMNDVKRARDTAIGARFYDASSASIVWLGYDAPQLDGLDVMSTDLAVKGAGSYNEFMSGLSATSHHADPHVTAIGHSYGSLTVGQAAQRHGGIPGADDIVLVGSPGTGARTADELGVGRHHVYVGAAQNDPVTELPARIEARGMGAGAVSGAVIGASLGGPAGAVAGGVAGGATSYFVQDAQADDREVWFGTDPANRAFGAQRFRVADGPRPVADLAGFAAHSNYFAPEIDRESADNIAKVVAGHGGEISRQEPR